MAEGRRRARSRFAACVLLAGGFAFAGPLPAQDAAVIKARLDSLLVLLPAAERAAAVADSLRYPGPRAATPDTVSVGPITVLVMPDQRRLAEGAFRAAWQAQKSAFGDSADLLSTRPFAFHYGLHFGNWSAFSADPSQLRTVLAEPIWFPGKTAGAISRQAAERALVAVVIERLPTAERRVLPVAGARPDLADVRRELATAPSVAVQRCYRGELTWCWEAVGSGEAADGWTRWYSADQRRLLVLETRTGFTRAQAELRAQCVTGRMPGACDGFLAARNVVAPPLSLAARRTLTREAFSLGGPGGYARLLEDTASSIRAGLARVAGMPPDSLVARWRRDVLAADPDADVRLGSRGWTALLWIMLMAGLAMRSTRWRSG